MSKLKVLFLVFLLGFFGYWGVRVFAANPSKQVPKSSIGYIDMQKALASHPGAEKAMETLKSFQEERQKDLDAKIKGKELTEEEQKQITLLAQRYEGEIRKKDNELTLEILKDIKATIEKVAKGESLTVVLDQEAVFYGGVDITDLVIKELEGTKGK
ncbi:MAG: hypothetical protein COS84_06190 [Armatimonadetes bacterium CG07_land_8_20_14_0_80_40_9]|nr:MAG: hypothetical protein COS84_06190 [Armatimonadetes bacterium CG07_land_8_20_14_0_80_40_9]